jgi:transglutaminase-like putative cysteine protease
MNKILLTLYIIAIIYIKSNVCFAQNDININFDSLVQKADAVVLEDITEIEIPDNYSAEYTISKKILIKNSKADEHCRVVISESHFQDIEDIEASITKVNGDLIKELETDEISEGEYSANAFYSGHNYKYFEMHHHSYPFIFNYSYKISISTLLLWPDWYPQESIPNLSSEYKLSINPDVKFRFYSKGIEIQPTRKSEDSFNQYIWEMENIPTKLEEDFLAPEDQIQKAIYFVAENFKTDSYEGIASSWDEYSNWYRKLASDRYELSNEAKNEILNLIKIVTEPKEKINILYKHLQKKNRYIAIEMGLAGWQPQFSDQVYKNRYGDCKDLSTYMVSMLKVAEINSYPALALTRDDGVVNPQQPSNQFNHCIVCVPFDTDTVWLECTSTYSDMEDVPFTIEDINVLVIGTKKGELVRTPQKKSNQNTMTSVFNGSIEISGDLKFDANILTRGNHKNSLKNNLAILNTIEDKIFITNRLSNNYSNLTIEKFESDETITENSRGLNLSLGGVYKRFLSQMSDRVFINPSIFNRKSMKDLPKEEISNRKYPVYFYYPYLDIDTVFISFPQAYMMESKPKNQSIEKSFARYSSEFDLKDGKLFYFRRFELLQNHIPISSYAEFYNFIKQVIEFDKSKFVLKKI